MVTIANVEQIPLYDYREIEYKGIIICAFKNSEKVHNFKTIGLAQNFEGNKFSGMREIIDYIIKENLTPKF